MVTVYALAAHNDLPTIQRFVDRWVTGRVREPVLAERLLTAPSVTWRYDADILEVGPCAAMLRHTADGGLLVGLEIAGVEVPHCETEENILMDNLAATLRILVGSVDAVEATVYFDDEPPLTKSGFIRDSRLRGYSDTQGIHHDEYPCAPAR
jgi:hypothetical protein